MGRVHKKIRRDIKRQDDHKLNQFNSKPRFQNQKALPEAQKQKNSHGNGKPQQAQSKVQFGKFDKILLVGEGDFTFALSLVQHHHPGAIVATCYDTQEQLEIKYPQAIKTIEKLRAPTSDTSKSTEAKETEWNGFSPSPDSDPGDDESLEGDKPQLSIHFGIDATKLSSTHRKLLRSKSPFTKIVFNFPHVGGLSTDVNRQVRSNQELLVGFFNAAKALLSSETNPASIPVKDDEEDEVDIHDDFYSDGGAGSRRLAVNGKILVTLFEGEPYTLWNIRDLARHCGLRVVESFAFPWAAYPGYQHARTIGNITKGKDRDVEGKRRGAWRGEERDARTYVLQIKDQDGDYEGARSMKKKKRSNRSETDSDSDADR